MEHEGKTSNSNSRVCTHQTSTGHTITNNGDWKHEFAIIIMIYGSSSTTPRRQQQQPRTSKNQTILRTSKFTIYFVSIGFVLIGFQFVVLFIGYRLHFGDDTQNSNGATLNHAVPSHLQHLIRSNSINEERNPWSPSTPSQQRRQNEPQRQQDFVVDDESNKNSPQFPPNPDGTFNGYPIYYYNVNGSSGSDNYYSSPLSGNMNGPTSIAHCIGENYQGSKSWMHRSCYYQFMCFNTKTNEFEIYQHPQEVRIQKYAKDRKFMDLSQSYNVNRNVTSVSLGGINLKWGVGTSSKNDGEERSGIRRLEWYPRIITNYQPTSFYILPASVVMVPFHSLAGQNPGHLVWDDFMSIYTLLNIFQLPTYHPLLIRYVLKPDKNGQGLWATCDYNTQKHLDCETMFHKFYPLMTTYNTSIITTQLETQFKLKNVDQQQQPKSSLICSRHAAAGIGSLTDHGTDKFHGWHDADYKITHNHGRAGLFYNFRQHTINNILRRGGSHESSSSGSETNNNYGTLPSSGPPYKIVFSKASSNNPRRALDFSSQLRYLEQELIEKKNKNSISPVVDIQSHLFKEYTLQEQLHIVSETSIYITGAGGGAVTASWLPKGSTVIIYYRSTGGQEQNKPTGLPARLDWDYFNNAGYLNVHWLPTETMNTYKDLQILLELITHEINVLDNKNDKQAIDPQN